MKTTALLTVLTAFSVIVLLSFATAQNHFDCVDAIEICDNASLNVQYDIAVGFIDEGVEEFCMSGFDASQYLETNTVWLKYHFKTTGDFLFTITPNEMELDIDFVAFKSEMKSCDDLEAIRCMFSGENVGLPIDTLCLGATGLSVQSTDIVEYPGCEPGNDNFLAPIEVSAGDIIYLAVTTFNGSPDFLIEHSGSAIIKCEPVSTTEISEHSVIIYPNPFEDLINVEAIHYLNKDVFYEIINVHGVVVKSGKMNDLQQIEAGNLSAGIYFLNIFDNNNGVVVKKLLKLK